MAVFHFSNVFVPFSKNRNPEKKWIRDTLALMVYILERKGESKNYPTAVCFTESSPLTNYICTGTYIYCRLAFYAFQYMAI